MPKHTTNRNASAAAGVNKEQAAAQHSTCTPLANAQVSVLDKLIPKGGTLPAPVTAPVKTAPRPHTKSERLLTLLRAGTGASLEEMIEATGWQSHTVRAAMTGLRKRGYKIERNIEGTTSVWSVKENSQ